MAKTFQGIRPADPGRYVRGEQPYGYAQCKREIRGHVEAVLAYAASLEPWPKGVQWRGGSMTVPPNVRKQQAAEDVLAMALETIASENMSKLKGYQTSLALDQEDRRQDLLLARYALKQARRLSA